MPVELISLAGVQAVDWLLPDREKLNRRTSFDNVAVIGGMIAITLGS
jgi:hypothetical protein